MFVLFVSVYLFYYVLIYINLYFVFVISPQWDVVNKQFNTIQCIYHVNCNKDRQRDTRRLVRIRWWFSPVSFTFSNGLVTTCNVTEQVTIIVQTTPLGMPNWEWINPFSAGDKFGQYKNDAKELKND